VNQEWRKSRKLEIAFIYALAAICTRYLQIDGRMLSAAHLDRALTAGLPTATERWRSLMARRFDPKFNF
jgi:hypothetical protein